MLYNFIAPTSYMPSVPPSLIPIVEGHAAALHAEGKTPEALAKGETAVTAAREACAGEAAHLPLLVQALENLAEIKRDAGLIDDAAALYTEAIDQAIKAGLDRSILAQIRTSLATALDNAGKEAESISIFEQAIKDLEEMEPPDNFTAGQLRNNVALNYKRMGKFALAEQHYLRSLEVLEANAGSDSEFVASIFNNLGGLYYAAGFAGQAKEMFDEAMAVRLKLLGENHPDVAQSHSNIGTVQHELGDNAAAMQSFERALRILEAHLPDEASSYEAVGSDYIALLGSIHEDQKAASFQKRMTKVLENLKPA